MQLPQEPDADHPTVRDTETNLPNSYEHQSPPSVPPMPPQYDLAGGHKDTANDSGQGAGVPAEIAAFRWHWGAFFFPWLWMFNHSLIGLGIVTLVVWILSLAIPGIGLITLCLAIYVASNGHKLAWRHRRFDGGVPQYLKVQRAWHNWALGFLLIVPFIAIFAAILFPFFAQARAAARKVTSVSNLKQIGLAMKLYEQRNNEKLPPMDTYDHFKSALRPYITSEDVFMEPGSGRSVTYALANNLSNKPLASIENPGTVVTLKGTVSYFGGINTLYADGHVLWERDSSASAVATESGVPDTPR